MNQTIEKTCKTHGLTSHRVGKDKRERCRKCSVEAVAKRRLKLKKLAVDYKGGACSNCGYDRYIGALEFHHRDPNEKDFQGTGGTVLSWDRIKVELDKCDMLCSNCHREVHHKIRNAP